jgi:hypothetical protein
MNGEKCPAYRSCSSGNRQSSAVTRPLQSGEPQVHDQSPSLPQSTSSAVNSTASASRDLLLRGLWLVNHETGERLSVMVFEDEAAAEAMFAVVGEHRAADPERVRPKPVSASRREVFARAGSLSRT